MSRYIKADALIEKFKAEHDWSSVYIVEDMLSADVVEVVHGEWIPCSERLPEEDEYVLATTVWGDITMAENLGDDMWFIHEGNSNAYTKDILAWMPLPQPWKGEENES